jgi:hypothetical protein
LPEDRHALRIPAKGSDIVPHPFEGGDEVEHPDIGGTRVAFAMGRQVEEAEQVQPVVERDDHNVAATGKIAAVEGRQVVPGPGREPAAVQPHHHRPLPVVADRGRPDIDAQAIFALDAVVPLEEERLLVVQPAGALVLGTDQAIVS